MAECLIATRDGGQCFKDKGHEEPCDFWNTPGCPPTEPAIMITISQAEQDHHHDLRVTSYELAKQRQHLRSL